MRGVRKNRYREATRTLQSGVPDNLRGCWSRLYPKASRSKYQKYPAPEAPAEAAPAEAAPAEAAPVGSGGGGGGGLVEKLRELNDARSEGLIDDAEFESLKSAALGRLIGSAAVAPSSGPSVVRFE